MYKLAEQNHWQSRTRLGTLKLRAISRFFYFDVPSEVILLNHFQENDFRFYFLQQEFPIFSNTNWTSH